MHGLRLENYVLFQRVFHTSGLIGKLCCVIGKLKKRSVCMQSAFLLFCCCNEKLMRANLSPSSTSTTMGQRPPKGNLAIAGSDRRAFLFRFVHKNKTLSRECKIVNGSTDREKFILLTFLQKYLFLWYSWWAGRGGDELKVWILLPPSSGKYNRRSRHPAKLLAWEWQ